MTTSSAAEPLAAVAGVRSSEPVTLLDVKLSADWDRAYAGEWFPLTFELFRSTHDSSPVRLHNLTCADPDVHLDIDLLQQGVTIRPGETYRFIVPLRVLRAKTVDVGMLSLYLGHTDGNGQEIVFPQIPSSKKFVVRPAIGNEITIDIESLCNYDEGTKLLLTLKHKGDSLFSDLTMNLGPAAALRAGKQTVQRTTFHPGEEEQVELVVASAELEVMLSASVKEARSEARRMLRVEPPVSRTEKRFRFLEPRRLARDQLRLYEAVADGPRRAVAEQHGVYLLEGGRKYLVEITPMQPGATGVHLKEIAGLLQVRKDEKSKEGAWVFVVDVTGPPLLRKPEQLFYEVETAEGKLSGEIPICLKAAAGRYLQVAAALGVAVTAQGAVGVARILHQVDYSLLEAVREFKPAEHFTVFFLLSIPVAWVGLRLIDWLQYQFVR
jgi:hypothetical protein